MGGLEEGKELSDEDQETRERCVAYTVDQVGRQADPDYEGSWDESVS